MRRWLSERLDDAMFPVLKAFNPGFRRRLASYRPSTACDVGCLSCLPVPESVSRQAARAWRGYPSERVSFQSPVPCSCTENQTVHATLFTADPTAPWTVIVPGYATGALPLYNAALFQDLQGLSLLRRGVNVALLELPYHLSRRRTGWVSGEGFFSPDLEETVTAFRQAAADCLTLVRWLQAESGQPVGLWGTSLGGNVAGLTATLEAQFGAVVLMEPLDNPGDPLAVHSGTREIRAVLAENGVAPTQLPVILAPLAPSTYRPAVPTERILFVTPLWDRVVLTRFQEAFWQAWGRPERIAVPAGHLTLPLDRSLNQRVADFLAGWLLGHAT